MLIGPRLFEMLLENFSEVGYQTFSEIWNIDKFWNPDIEHN